MNSNELFLRAWNWASFNFGWVILGIIAFKLAIFSAAGYVAYRLYVRLGDILNELKGIRQAYDRTHAPVRQTTAHAQPQKEFAWPAPPKPLIPVGDEKYLPKT